MNLAHAVKLKLQRVRGRLFLQKIGDSWVFFNFLTTIKNYFRIPFLLFQKTILESKTIHRNLLTQNRIKLKEMFSKTAESKTNRV